MACPTGKVAYDSAAAAHRAINVRRGNHKRGIGGRRVMAYRCDCGSWHLGTGSGR